MLFPSVELYEVAEDTISARVTIDSNLESPGIRQVRVVDHGGSPLIEVDLECLRSARFVVPDIPRSRLPIRVMTTECTSPGREPVQTTSPPYFGEEARRADARVSCRPRLIHSPNVNNPRCIDNQARLQAKQIEIIGLCGQAGRIKSDRDINLAASIALYILAAALLILGILASLNIFGGQSVATVLFIGAAIALFAAVGYTMEYVKLNAAYEEKLKEVTKAQQDYQAIADQTDRVCCEEFVYAPRVPPSC